MLEETAAAIDTLKSEFGTLLEKVNAFNIGAGTSGNVTRLAPVAMQKAVG